MIAHRLSTVRQCDRIIVMERGRLCGIDTWTRLLAENAPFRRIVEASSTEPGAATVTATG